MSIVKVLDSVRDWVQEKICPQIMLKVPAEDIEPNDRDYDYKLVNPTAFTLFVPTKDKLPPPILSSFPSACVRFMEGADDMAANEGSIGIQLCFSAWNPGTHDKDVFHPAGDGSFRQGTGGSGFTPDGEGWRDVWNFVDIALREVESTTTIGGYVIDRSVPVKFGPLAEQEAIPDFYPLWFAWISFQLTYPIRRNNEDVQKYL